MNRSNRSRLKLVTVLVISLGCCLQLMAQPPAPPKEDERILRDLIRQVNEGKVAVKFTDDAIFVSAVYPRPLIGQKERDAARPIAEKVAAQRPNQTIKREMLRLVVAASGDLAYEFGNHTISWDGPDKKRTGFEGSYLRVWRKDQGEWKVDAFFNRPNETKKATAPADPIPDSANGMDTGVGAAGGNGTAFAAGNAFWRDDLDLICASL